MEAVLTHALTTLALTKRFAAHVAVDNLSIEVPDRSIFGFLGANGAGKTTALRLILGLLRADAGRIILFGKDVRRGGASEVGALIESPSLYPHLSGAENLDITRRLLGLPRREIDRVLDTVDLADVGSKRVGGYSLGMRQRLAIARALLGRPRLLILDEPTNGLDPEGIIDMRALIRRLPDAERATVMVSSHLLAEVEQVATDVAMIHRGRLLVQERLSTLLAGAPLIEVGTTDQPATAHLLRNAGYAVDEENGGHLLVHGAATRPADDMASDDLAGLLVANGQVLRHLARRRATLEGVYHHHLALAA